MTIEIFPDRRAKSVARNASELVVTIPTLHGDQVRALAQQRAHERFAVRCGRRWGKTVLGETFACDDAIKGRAVGWFAPNYKTASAAFKDITAYLTPIKLHSNKTDGFVATRTGGSVEVWTLENENAGRSRRYDTVIFDEAAFGDDNLMDVWEQAIEPTLLDFQGRCIVLSNTNGINRRNFFWRICNQPEHGFSVYHAPSWKNPLVPRRKIGESYEEWLARRAFVFGRLRAKRPPLVYAQEYLAEFVDWSGVAFFEKEKLLVDGLPVAMPTICDIVFAVIDSAAKTGKENDGTAVIYFAQSDRIGWPLVILDYELMQIEGQLLDTWLPTVFTKLQGFAAQCRARMGVAGVWIEDKSTGMVLLQRAQTLGMNVHAIDNATTALGKSERAISASPHVYQGAVKISHVAYDNVITYKGVTENHLLTQVTGFRVGVKDQVDDDLLDCFTYGINLGLGNAEGF